MLSCSIPQLIWTSGLPRIAQGIGLKIRHKGMARAAVHDVSVVLVRVQVQHYAEGLTRHQGFDAVCSVVSRGFGFVPRVPVRVSQGYC